MLPLASFAQSVWPSPSTSMQNPYDRCSSRSVLFNFDVRRFGELISQLPIWHLREDGAVGEGSIALADKVGIWSDARRGGSRGGIL